MTYGHFEVGKYYRWPAAGRMLHIVGAVPTTVHGWTLVAEELSGRLTPVTQQPPHATCWEESTEAVWTSLFPEKGDAGPPLDGPFITEDAPVPSTVQSTLAATGLAQGSTELCDPPPPRWRPTGVLDNSAHSNDESDEMPPRYPDDVKTFTRTQAIKYGSK